jgi:hypothetical protein
MVAGKKSQAFAEGDVFLVSLNDASHCVGQVLNITKSALNSCICAFFDVRLPEGAREVHTPLNEGNLIAVQFVTPDLLKKGYWPVIDKRDVAVDVEKTIPLRRYEQEGFVGAKVIGSGIIREFLSAYYALRPWDTWHDPGYLDKLLVSRDKRPANVILTK